MLVLSEIQLVLGTRTSDFFTPDKPPKWSVLYDKCIRKSMVVRKLSETAGEPVVPDLKDKYPNFEVGLRCILMVITYLLLCSYTN